jgi:hypothetical protein
MQLGIRWCQDGQPGIVERVLGSYSDAFLQSEMKLMQIASFFGTFGTIKMNKGLCNNSLSILFII